MIYIHKGDSTVFANVNKFLTFNIITQLELSDWTATFQLGSITKTIDDITSKSFEVVLTAQDTSNLLYGEMFGSLKLTDNNGNIKTIINTIPFCITNEVIESQFEILDLTIPETAGVEIALTVGVPNGTGGGSVYSVNGKIGDVVLTAEDVGALPSSTVIPDTSDLATKSELTDSLATKQPVGDYALADDVPTLLSQLQNDSGYMTQAQIIQLIANIPKFSILVVNSLPTVGSKMTLYLVPKEGTGNDVHNEYVWIDTTSSYEFIGTTAVDLSNYVQTNYYANPYRAGLVKPAGGFNLSYSTGEMTIAKATNAEINAKSENFKPIVPSNLNYAVNSVLPTMTQAEYDALETKDENLFYMIVEE